MAKDYNQVLLDKGYSQEQIDSMVGAVNSGQNANDVVQNYTPTTPSSSSSSSSSSSGGNYVYNESTGYYEQQTPSSSSSSSSNSGSYTYNPTSGYYEQQSTPSGRSSQQTTQTQNIQQPKQQTQTAGNTVSDVQQQGAMKPLSQEYYNQTSDNALNTIRNNLNNYRQTNPEYFTDYDTFKRNFSYDSRNDEQKNLLDTWYNGYQSQLQLSSVPTTDLYTQYKDGQLSAADLEGLRISNPEKYAELQAQINKGNIVAAYDDDKGVDTTGMSLQDMAYNMAMQTFTKFMNGETSSAASNIFREYEDKMESPEMLSLADQTTEVQEQIENIQSDLDSIKKSVEAEYAGTGASRSKINAIIADRSYDLQLQLRTLNSEYNKYATQYNNRMQQYQNEFSMQLQEYQINQQERNQQMQELGFALDLMNFETNDQKAQREWDYWVKQQEYQNGNINSKDYQTRYKAALTSVQNLLSQYPGIPMVRSAEQMAQDVLKAIDSGSDLGAELTKINQQIQQKPEYRYMYNQTYGIPTSTTGGGFTGKSIKVGDMELFEYGDKRLTADEIRSMYGGAAGGTGEAKPYDVVDASAFSLAATSKRDNNLGGFLRSIGKTGTKGGQCGKFVNDYLQKIGVGRYYDNELSTKLNSVNDYTPQVGAIAVFDYGHKSSDGVNYGHVGIVTQVYDDGSFDVLDSNYGGDEKIQKRHINPGSSSLKGFFNPSKPPMSATSGNTKATATNAFTTAGNNIALNLGSVSATNTFNEQLKNYVDNGNYTNAFEYITTQAKQSADSDTRQAINSAESAISALVSIQQGLDAFQAAGGNTGIFAGTAEQVANKIGKTTNPELKKLATQINVAIQKYRQAISGAAFSEQEAAEYAAIFPSTKNSKALNTALIEGTLDTMLQNLNSSYASILGTDTYTSLLQAYQSTTGNIYDYYGGKQALTRYLKDNGYFVGGKSSGTTSRTSTTTTTKYDPKKAIEDVVAKFRLK